MKEPAGVNTKLLQVAKPKFRLQKFRFGGLQKWDITSSLLAWAWLAKAKGHSCHTKKSTLAKTFMEKKQVKVRSTPATTLQKEDPLK